MPKGRVQPGIAHSGPGPGQVSGVVEMPTFDVPCGGLCTWIVVRPGPGRASVSRLKYRNMLCTARHPKATQ